MKLTYLFLALSICTNSCSTRFLHKSIDAKHALQSAPFPKRWEGSWHGELEIFAAKSTQKVDMWIEIAPIDTSRQGRWTFGLVYGSKEKDWRPYELIPIDTAQGIWAVDEKNSIQMESYLRGPKLLCWFVVQGSRVLCTYELVDSETLIFEVISGREKPVSTTGNAIQNHDTIPEVVTYPFSVFQRARLKRTSQKN